MVKSKNLLEEEINETPFFSARGDRMAAARSTAEYKLVRNIWDYCKNYWYGNPGRSKEWFEKYNGEIDEAIVNCLKPGNFNPEKRIPFINYLKRAIHNEISEAKMKETREIERDSDPVIKNSEGEEVLLVENLEPHYQDPGGTVNDELEIIRYYLDVIEKEFIRKPDKIKTELKKYITLLLFDPLSKLKARKELDKFGQKEFIDYEMLEKYKSDRKLPTQKSIAGSFLTKRGNPKTESSASRTLNNFIRAIKPRFEDVLRKQGISYNKYFLYTD
jgi:hypothetical protein